ncbi:hypothetical protein [Vibrio alginolyticus]|uniref:hypothetical protein n=1 Tax=Vibrio alginolyticus TaxID=663 RepID=UPI003754D07C
MLKTNISRVAYFTCCYLFIWDFSKARPRAGSLSDIHKYYDEKLSVFEVFEKIYGQPTEPAFTSEKSTAFKCNSKGEADDNSSSRYENVRIVGFNTAISTTGSIDAHELEIDDCLNGITAEETEVEGKSMVLNVTKGKFRKVEKVLSAPSSAELNFDDPDVEDAGTVFEIYVSQEDLQKHDLPSDIPQELLVDVLEKLAKIENDDKDEAVSVISKHPLAEWMGFAADTLTVGAPFVTALLSLSSSF